MEVEAEGREGTRQRLQQRFKKQPIATAKFFPLSGQRLAHRRQRTAVGTVEIEVLHGQDPKDACWGCPIGEHWGLSAHWGAVDLESGAGALGRGQ
jgi:hypothetical protein